MRDLVWTPAFRRAARRALGRRPELRSRFERALESLAVDPFQPGLRSHKLHGELHDVWSCTVDYEYRILFRSLTNPDSGDDEVHLLTVGTHDEVY